MHSQSNLLRRFRTAIRFAATTLVALVVSGIGSIPFAHAQAPSIGRMIVSPDTTAGRASLDTGVVQSQPVNVDLRLLAEIRDRLLAGQSSTSAATAQSAAQSATPMTPATQQIALPTFGTDTLTLILTRVETIDGAVAFHGMVAGVALSSVVLVERQGIVAGNINALEKNYQIRYRGPEFGHELREFNQALFRDHDDAHTSPKVPDGLEVAPDTGLKSGKAIEATEADDGSTIDVMVVYTAAARTAAGGTPAMQTLIALGVTETNAAYANAGVIQRVRLVYSMESTYTESGDFSTDLTRLTVKTDGFLDEVHAARDAHGADLVSLWIENASTTCGLAYVMNTVSTSFEATAFSVVNRSCATGYYSFGHEMGHNMGLRHDPFVDTSSTPYPYAHGYVDPVNKFRTVMGYNNACGNVNCPRIQYFSNPGINYVGNTTGNSTNANAKLALDNTRVTAANFRQSISTSTAPAITSATNVTFYVGIPGSFNVTASGSPAPTLSASGALPGSIAFSPTGLLAGTPNLANIGVYPLTFSASNGTAPNATQNFTLTIGAAPLCILDLDGNGTVDALTDGVMIMRTIFGLTGVQVTAGAIGNGATRTTWAQISPLLSLALFDIDGNGRTDALTDGLIIVRAMFGLTGTAVTTNALGTNPPATRNTWTSIRGYLNSACGANFAP